VPVAVITSFGNTSSASKLAQFLFVLHSKVTILLKLIFSISATLIKLALFRWLKTIKELDYLVPAAVTTSFGNTSSAPKQALFLFVLCSQDTILSISATRNKLACSAGLKTIEELAYIVPAAITTSFANTSSASKLALFFVLCSQDTILSI
jgi:hypothetical protein